MIYIGEETCGHHTIAPVGSSKPFLKLSLAAKIYENGRVFNHVVALGMAPVSERGATLTRNHLKLSKTDFA